MKKKNKVIRIRLVPMLILFALIIFMPSKLSEKKEILEIASTERHSLTSYMGTNEWYKDYTYELNDDNLTIILSKYNGEVTDVIIPATAIIDEKTYSVSVEAYLFNSNENITSVKFEDGVSALKSLSSFFNGCINLRKVEFNRFDSSNVTNMEVMFDDCKSLTEVDLINLNTKNVTSFYCMFSGCMSLTQVDVSHFDTENATGMNSMFSNCKNLNSIDVSNFNTSNVQNMDGMFYNCQGLTQLDLTNFNTINVTNMSSMFKQCSNLAELDLSSFDTRRVRKSSDMFYGCYKLTEKKLGENWNLTEDGKVILPETRLTINPHGGTWNNSTEKVTFQQKAGTTIDIKTPTPPNGYEVTFDTNGGKQIEKITSTKEFTGWDVKEIIISARDPSGSINGTIYTFGNSGDDTATAQYKDIAITLPTVTREGYTFEGWYTDRSLRNKAGNANESYTVTKATTLYAKWRENPLDDTIASDVYTIDEEKRIINKVSIGEKVEDFKKKVEGLNYKITDKDGKELENDEIIGTGCILKTSTKEYKIVVPGDLNGTGNIDLNDLAQVQKLFLELIKNDELKSLAADLNENGKIDLNDLAKLQKIFLGK